MRYKDLGMTHDIKHPFSKKGEEEIKQKTIIGMMRGNGYSDKEIMDKYPKTKPFLKPKATRKSRRRTIRYTKRR